MATPEVILVYIQATSMFIIGFSLGILNDRRSH
ncbi:hypothetical protein HOR70_gp11 [Pectobacterium phage PPWS4]|uniref:Uncharacterized protein n=1 Tax=Pectobacterium phage PPWS4 TaxID=1961914 RepID=A0A250KA77_9CAUD|nr:hypothetical protein HOR70_gp11 [Pectobacterium phage PPWS4]BBA26426.1 hypothetical protein [Pectobacterium phage PPWS4]